jgi:hypothetical protein
MVELLSDGRDLSRAVGVLLAVAVRLMDHELTDEVTDEYNGCLRESFD